MSVDFAISIAAPFSKEGSMTEPFSIACTTCQAKLKVRDPSAIGQILPCPKCGSMVLIEPPAGETVDDLRLSKSTSAPRSSRTPKTVPSAPHESVAVSAAASASDSPGQGVTAESPSDPAAGDAIDPEPICPAPDEVADDLDDWLASPSQRLRQIVLVAVAGCIGIGLAVVVFLFFVRETEKPTGGVAEANTVADEKSISGNEPEADHDQVFPAPTSESDTRPPPESTAIPAALPDESSPPLPSESSVPPEPSPSTSEPSPSSPPDLGPAPAVADPGKKAFGRNFPQGFEKFENLLGGNTVTGQPPAAAAMGAPPGPAAAASPTRPPLNPVDVPARLADPIAGIEFTDTPLLDALRFVSQLSTVPITLVTDDLPDPRAVLAARISLRLEDTTAAGVLEGILSPLQLNTTERDGQLLVHASTSPDQPIERELSVAEWTDGDRELGTRLVGLIQECIQPATWEGRGGNGTVVLETGQLKIHHIPSVIHQVTAFCSQFQLARRVAAGDASNRPPTPDSVLAQPVTLTAIRPTSLPRIVERIEKALPVKVLIDWTALSQVNWGMETTTTYSSDQKPLRDTLESLLAPLGLGFRIVDGDLLEITSSARLASRPDFAFYGIGDLVSESRPAEELVGELRRSLGLGADAPGMLLRYDPPSRHLITSLPAPLQTRLAAILQGLRAAQP